MSLPCCYSHFISGHSDLAGKQFSCIASNYKVETQTKSLDYGSYLLSIVPMWPL